MLPTTFDVVPGSCSQEGVDCQSSGLPCQTGQQAHYVFALHSRGGVIVWHALLRPCNAACLCEMQQQAVGPGWYHQLD